MVARSQISLPVSVPNGGTGSATLTSNQSLWGNGASALVADSGFTRTSSGGRYLFGATDNGIDKVQVNGGLSTSYLSIGLNSSFGPALQGVAGYGDASIIGYGDSVNPSSSIGGSCFLVGGDGDLGGGSVVAAGGQGGGGVYENVSGGVFQLASGVPTISGAGADISLFASDGLGSATNPNQNGGNFFLYIGSGTGTGTRGYLQVTDNSSAYGVTYDVTKTAALDLPIVVDGVLYRIALRTY